MSLHSTVTLDIVKNITFLTLDPFLQQGKVGGELEYSSV